jgi:two-component system response regulator (stage 0 sporulation protein F)
MNDSADNAGFRQSRGVAAPAGSILLVDDNALLLSGMKRIFEKEFEQVLTAPTAKDALAHFQERPCPIIVLDINLPDMNGCEVLEFIKRRSPESMVIIITSDGDERLKEEVFRKGAFEFLEKPFDIHSLRDALSRLSFFLEKEKRVKDTLEVRIEQKHRGLVYNLSPTGLSVTADVLYGCGTVLDMAVCPADKEEIALKGFVVRTVDTSSKPQPPPDLAEMKYGLGIKLINRPPLYSSLINSLLY